MLCLDPKKFLSLPRSKLKAKGTAYQCSESRVIPLGYPGAHLAMYFNLNDTIISV